MTLRFNWSSFPFVHVPRDYQLDALDATWDRPYWAYFMWPRLGKTKLTIDVMMAQTLAGKIGGAIITAKAGEYRNWSVIEIPKHWNSEALPIDVEVWDSQYTEARERDLRARLMDGAPRFKVLVVNVESLLWGWQRKRKVPRRALALCFDFISYLQRGDQGCALVVDEATCVKNHTAGRSEAVYDLRRRCNVRRILTGTPVTESPLYLWGQSKALGENLFPHPNFTTFRAHHAIMEKVYIPGGGSVETVAGYKNMGELMDIVAQWSTTLGPEYLKLLPPTRTIIPVELDTTQRKYYDQMANMSIAELEGGGLVTAANKLALMSKMHQIVCGHLKENLTTTHSFSHARVDALMTFLEPRPWNCLIWAVYRQSVEDAYEAIAKRYGPESVGKIYGGVRDKMALVQRFQDPHDPMRFLVCNQQSAGYGLTLDTARSHIYFANEFSGERRIQSEQRGNSPDNPWSIEIADIIATGTVDQRYYQVLKSKSNMLSDFMKGSLSMWDMLHPDPAELLATEAAEPSPWELPPELLAMMERDLGNAL